MELGAIKHNFLTGGIEIIKGMEIHEIGALILAERVEILLDNMTNFLK